jgi:hypothetical protein
MASVIKSATASNQIIKLDDMGEPTHVINIHDNIIRKLQDLSHLTPDDMRDILAYVKKHIVPVNTRANFNVDNKRVKCVLDVDGIVLSVDNIPVTDIETSFIPEWNQFKHKYISKTDREGYKYTLIDGTVFYSGFVLSCSHYIATYFNRMIIPYAAQVHTINLHEEICTKFTQMKQTNIYTDCEQSVYDQCMEKLLHIPQKQLLDCIIHIMRILMHFSITTLTPGKYIYTYDDGELYDILGYADEYILDASRMIQTYYVPTTKSYLYGNFFWDVFVALMIKDFSELKKFI